MNHCLDILISLFLITEGTYIGNPDKSPEESQMACLGKARIWTCTSIALGKPGTTSLTSNQRVEMGILSVHKWAHEIKLLLCKQMQAHTEKYSHRKPDLLLVIKATSSSCSHPRP